MARKSGRGVVIGKTPTGKTVEIDPNDALEKYKHIREGSLKGSTRTRQLIEEGRKYEEEHGNRNSE